MYFGDIWRDAGTPADSYYEVRPECIADVPESKFRIKVCFLEDDYFQFLESFLHQDV